VNDCKQCKGFGFIIDSNGKLQVCLLCKNYLNKKKGPKG